MVFGVLVWPKTIVADPGRYLAGSLVFHIQRSHTPPGWLYCGNRCFAIARRSLLETPLARKVWTYGLLGLDGFK